jgi:hypothetical protein
MVPRLHIIPRENVVGMVTAEAMAETGDLVVGENHKDTTAHGPNVPSCDDKSTTKKIST